MRITGGQLGGRLLRVPAVSVRPTQDRVRQALFSSLAVRVAGCRFLDLFAGTGAVGLEAFSRGADRVVVVESNAKVFRILSGNIAAVGADRTESLRAVCSDAFMYVRHIAGRETFDLIFADPPYDAAGTRLWGEKLLDALGACRCLAEDGFFILEQARGERVPRADGWALHKESVYGSTVLRWYVRT